MQIDFGPTTDNVTGNWNFFTNPKSTISNAIDFNTGLGTGVTLSLAATGWYTSTGEGFATTSWVQSGASDDCIFSAGSGTFTFGGLNPGAQYSLQWVASTADDFYSTSGSYSANGVYADRNYNNTQTDISSWNPYTAKVNKDWLIWDSVTADQNGTISFVTTTTGFGNGAFANAAQLSENAAPVPEPGTWVAAALLIGGAGVMGSRRRQRA